LLSVTSKGEFNKKLKELPYDKLYHLFLVIQLSNGKKYVLEKNEVIYLYKLKSIPKKTESLEIVLNDNSLTMITLLDKTQAIMQGNYFSYNSSNNNCQIFVYNILKANALGNNENTDFIVQKTESLFQNDNRFRKLVNSVTDAGSIAQNISQNINVFSPYNSAGNIGNALLNHDYTGYTLSPFKTIF
jgi:hypothetical protein